MDPTPVILWFVCLTCVWGMVLVATRLRSGRGSWMAVYLAILLVCGSGWLSGKSKLVYLGLGMWLVLLLCPGLLSRLYFQRFLQQRYPEARRLARTIFWLHPSRTWSQQTEILAALELAQKGDFAAATAGLERFAG